MPSKEFEERKIILDLKKQLEKYRHKLVIDELVFRRDSDIMHHNMELERMRIKISEIKKTIAMRNER